MSKGPDPKNTPLVINLETLPTRSCAIGTVSPVSGDSRGGYSVWYYDQRNRIMTPSVYSYPVMADLLINLTGFLADTRDDEQVMGYLRGALYQLQIQQREKKQQAIRSLAGANQSKKTTN